MIEGAWKMLLPMDRGSVVSNFPMTEYTCRTPISLSLIGMLWDLYIAEDAKEMISLGT